MWQRMLACIQLEGCDYCKAISLQLLISLLIKEAYKICIAFATDANSEDQLDRS